MDIIKGIDNNTFNLLGMFLVIFPAVVYIKDMVSVLGQFWGYFIINALIMYLAIPPSNPISHDLAHLDLGDQCFRFVYVFIYYGNKKAEGCIPKALKRSN